MRYQIRAERAFTTEDIVALIDAEHYDPNADQDLTFSHVVLFDDGSLLVRLSKSVPPIRDELRIQSIIRQVFADALQLEVEQMDPAGN